MRNGLRVWLDASGDYTAFVDRLDDPGFPLVCWRSSYIEAILALVRDSLVPFLLAILIRRAPP